MQRGMVLLEAKQDRNNLQQTPNVSLGRLLEGFPSVRSCGLSTKHRRPLPIFLRNGVKMSTNMKIKKRALTLHLLLKNHKNIVWRT